MTPPGDDVTPGLAPDGPLPDYLHAPLAALGVQVGAADGTPLRARHPHEVLLDSIEDQGATLTAVITLLEHRGLVTREEVAVVRREIAAAEAIDAEIGLTRRLVDEGLIESTRTALARAERLQECRRPPEEDSR